MSKEIEHNCCCLSYQIGVSPCQCGCHKEIEQNWEEELKTALKIFKVDALTPHQMVLFVKDILSHQKQLSYNEALEKVEKKIKKVKEAVREHNGTFKYDDCYDDCLSIITNLKK